MKNKKTIIIVVAAVVVIGLAYYGFNRWRQQQVANQILKSVYGINAGGVLGNLGAGAGGNLADIYANELAKEAAKEKADAAKEAAKTPEDKYNETQSASIIGDVSPVMTSEITPAINAVFGKSKIISYGGGYMITQTGSFGATVKVPRVVTANDLNQLALEMKNKGYTVASSSVESESGEVSLMKGEGASLSFTYSDSGADQEVEVLYWSLGT